LYFKKVEVYNKAGALVGGAPPRAVVQYLGFEKEVDKDEPWIIVQELRRPESLVTEAKTDKE
jgi:hypothetical protein